MPRSARRALLRSLVCCAAVAVSGAAWAQSGKTVRILVGFPAGGGTDAIARTLADRLKDELGATVVVENKPGAGGQLAAQALKASPPDGSTFFISHDHTITILPLVMKNPGFEPARDFVPVAGFASFVNAFALSPGTPAKSLDDYVGWVKGQGQGKGVVGVPAPASTPEFLVKVLGEKFKLDLTPAPYRGSAPMMGDMLGNQIAAGVGSVPDFIENHKAGRIRVVALGGAKRQPTLPDVPTLAELGVSGFEDLPYYGFFAPAGTPKAAIDQFSQALAKVITVPEVKERLTNLGLAVEFMSSQQLASRERDYAKSWTEIIRKSGFQPQ
ncbi:Bug family tripartite tricarboxylate transporter substrate binding protein [Piscinibacter sp. XHJ-5]|uniref:Bug family tripartite tricarboxylate transporter substrate binding protein n=1 Tax=Piscinibacter sp. XHJ-5 TaxID=3037797 RepID=UPI002453494C|nr:Bug family tripartite tricarboxylate transporter substrate binding protein [Piscinibacter sp. XHJ-5]